MADSSVQARRRTDAPAPPLRRRTLSPHVHTALRVIRRQYCEPLTLARVADLCGITPDYLGALFRSQLGATFHACLVRARMRAAARLLRKGVKAEAVAQLVGYRSRQNFHQQFVRSFDTTPASYRR